MQNPALAPLSALAALSLASPAGEVQLAFEPELGRAHVLVLETERELAGGELVVVMNGAEVPGVYLPELRLEESDHKLLRLVESYGDEDGGRTCTRLYDELLWENEGTMEMTMQEATEGFPWTMEAASPFEGRTLRFAENGAGHDVRVADELGDTPELTGELHAELGLRQLLPPGAVEVGDTWTVAGGALALLFDPGAGLSWDLPEEAARYMQPEITSRSFEGCLELRLASVADGRATCAVRGELVRVTVGPGDLSQVPVVDGTATDTTEEAWEAEGSLVWDLEHDRLAELQLYGELSSETTTLRDPDQPGSTYESVFSVEGTYEVTVSCEAEDRRAVEARAAR